MKKNLSNKIFALGLILLFIGFGIHPVVGIFSNTENENHYNSAIDDSIYQHADKSKIRIFILCKIESLSIGGKAYLFPGYFDSLNGGKDVFCASGFCVAGNKTETQALFINGEDFSNWQWMFVSLYTGVVNNYSLTNPGIKIHVFDLIGRAGFLIVSY